MIKRYDIYTKYNKYKSAKNLNNMNEICSPSLDFKLQVQQNFLKDYISNNEWSKLLLYHEIGSGKTCTAITIAEEYLEKNKDNSVLVILPARLKTNFIDELISPCGGEKYISNIDFIKYNSSSISLNEKAKIRKEFMKNIELKYEIISFDKFKRNALKFPNIDEWINTISKNKLIIVDEVHNLISTNYNSEILEKFKQEKVIKGKKIKGIMSMLFKLLTIYADVTCKMILLTATPIFDNSKQFIELIKIMNNNIKKNEDTDLINLIEYLRGKISYFPGVSINAYPDVEYNIKDINISKEQYDDLMPINDEDEYEEKEEEDNKKIKKIKDSYLIKQRQNGIACNIKISKILKNLDIYAPKIKSLLDDINTKKGKHLVYSTFIDKGLNIVKEVLDNKGLIDFSTIQNDPDKIKQYYYKIYAVWDGKVKDNDKSSIKSIVNSKENIDGKFIRVVLGSPSIKEGVSFKHMQYMHILDPVWNQSAKTQLEGRVIRFCSHVDIPIDHPILKRKVIVNIYKLINTKDSNSSSVLETADERIYNTLIPNKFEKVKKIENALKKVSIDYHLFKNLYLKEKSESPKKTSNLSSILKSEENIDIMEKVKPKIPANTCMPKERRPVDGKCLDDNHIIKKNKDGYDCCYKKHIEKNTCMPKERRPVDGKCLDENHIIKKNKNGFDCCYKK